MENAATRLRLTEVPKLLAMWRMRAQETRKMSSQATLCPFCRGLNSAGERRCYRCGRSLPGPLATGLIGFFKNTSLVVVIGLFDFLSSVKLSLNEPAWSGFGVEAYLFAALVYFAFCYPLSLYSRRLERRL